MDSSDADDLVALVRAKRAELEDKLARIGDEAEAGEQDQTDRPIPPHVKVAKPNQRFGADIEDVDLAETEVIVDGERLTDDRADSIAAEVLAKARAYNAMRELGNDDEQQ